MTERPQRFQLRLGTAYYNQGFFNVPVPFDDLVPGHRARITLALGEEKEIEAEVNRRANPNGTARIMGKAALRDWIQREFSPGNTIEITFISPDRLRLDRPGRSSGRPLSPADPSPEQDPQASPSRKQGAYFARRVGDYLASQGHSVSPEYALDVGFDGYRQKTHKFDWGNDSLLVECKEYRWTRGGNNPSAKFSTANEALLYFQASPLSYRKILFFSATERSAGRAKETLAEYYVRRYGHLIPPGVEIVELDSGTLEAMTLWPSPSF